MFYYWSRKDVREQLRISPWISYRLFPLTPSRRIRSSDVVELLNKSRVGIKDPLFDAPSDLMTPEETVKRFAKSGITLADLRRWTRRTLKVAPHFRITSKITRFSEAMLNEWLAAMSAPGPHRYNKRSLAL
ncbi:MAG: hypothetical protein IKO43_05245 [Kiritimatiellae bacterium]|nr:hypothetical protein [Kiritimatiellia bacterium]